MNLINLSVILNQLESETNSNESWAVFYNFPLAMITFVYLALDFHCNVTLFLSQHARNISSIVNRRGAMLSQCLLTFKRAITVIALVWWRVSERVEMLIQSLLTFKLAIAVVALIRWRVSGRVEMLIQSLLTFKLAIAVVALKHWNVKRRVEMLFKSLLTIERMITIIAVVR